MNPRQIEINAARDVVAVRPGPGREDGRQVKHPGQFDK